MRLIAVVGASPGIGKSRLCMSLADWLTAEGRVVDHFREEEVLTRPAFAQVAADFTATATVTPTVLVDATVRYDRVYGEVMLPITAQQEDQEPLTDLLTVFFGLGIFTANAAFDYSREAAGDHVYRRTSRLGYLTEPRYGYALAWYAWFAARPTRDG